MSASADRLLEQIQAGDREAAQELVGIVYEELHRMAGRLMADAGRGHTLQTTALVHEAWIKLFCKGTPPGWESERHFLRVAARAMRQVLVDHVRAKRTLRRASTARRPLRFRRQQRPDRLRPLLPGAVSP